MILSTKGDRNQTCTDPVGDRRSGPPHHKAIGFLSNSGPDPLKNHKTTKLGLPSQGFWRTGGKCQTGKQRPNCEGNKDNIGGTRNIKTTTHFRFLGNRGTSQFISGEQGNRYPHGRASMLGQHLAGRRWPAFSGLHSSSK